MQMPPSRSVDRNEPVLLCLSHLRWNFVYQRPQHLLTRAAASHRVIFFEEPLHDDGIARLEITHHRCGVTVAVPHLPIGTSPSQATRLQRNWVEELVREADPHHLTVWYYTPHALTFARGLRPDVCVYDNMDELSSFRGASPSLLRLERELFELADVVFTGGHSLFEAKRYRHRNIHPFPSSIDTMHFGRARSGDRRPMSEQAALPRPRLGFFGVIDERMDIDLVAGIADRRPDWQIVMIGPVVKIDPATLPQRENLHWIGQKSYRELPDYLAGWDVGMMPFALNEATRFISPTKTPEFLAAGLPVVSTPIADVVRPYGNLGLVEIADGTDEFVAHVAALLERPREAWLRRVDEFLSRTSWDDTWERMLSLMDATNARRGVVRRSAVDPEEAHV